MTRYLSTLGFSITIMILLTSIGLGTAAAATSPRGYQSRPCGLDMNRNGILGEIADCKVCDGLTLDPDSDGIFEDLIYIDCGLGIDSATCGSPVNPCRTIEHAWNERADGAGDGAEDILCFRGICTDEEDTAPGVSGVPGFYIKPRSGSEARDWQLPANPTMLVGWDHDADGRYPPFDSDDTAILDGGVNSLKRALHFNSNGAQSFIEVAHFSARDYGRFGPEDTNLGFMRVGSFGPESTHVYLHDLQLERINRGRPSGSTIVVFNFFRGGTIPRWWAISNVNVVEMASWLARGAAQETVAEENGPFRLQNLSVTVFGCSQSQCGNVAATTLIKMWGYVSGVEVLDNRFDLNAAAWLPGGNPSNAISPAQCSRDWMIRNNEIIDFQRALNVEAFAPGFCDGPVARTVDDVVFDRNLFRNSYDWGFGDPAVLVETGNSSTETIENLTITNNVFSSSFPLTACIWSMAGNPQAPNPGQIRITGNTCLSDIDRFAAFTLSNPNGPEPLFPQDDYVIENNLVAGLGPGDLNILTENVLTDLKADYNLYDDDAGFEWGGSHMASLAVWQGSTGNDNHSRDCAPQFKSADDFHLSLNDSCARDAGRQIQATDFDIDGDPRGLGTGWEIGADEVKLPIFSGSFDLGDLNQWSTAEPGI